MDPVKPDIHISDLVVSTAGRDQGELFYCVGNEGRFVMLANGKDRTLDKPKRKSLRHVRKVLRSETRVAQKLASGDKVLNSELRRDLAFHADQMQSIDLLGG